MCFQVLNRMQRHHAHNRSQMIDNEPEHPFFVIPLSRPHFFQLTQSPTSPLTASPLRSRNYYYQTLTLKKGSMFCITCADDGHEKLLLLLDA